jgi:hypothetical protein
MGIVIRNTNQGGRIIFRSLGLGGRITSIISPSALLLDTYPGAAAAYSLRKLSSTYNGSAIRVRRSSDNTEQDIGFVNNVLDTTTLLTFCGVGNGFVTIWYDQSGNTKNAEQTTTTLQPLIVGSGAIYTKNSKPTIYTSGTYLSLTSYFSGTAGTLINITATTTDLPAGFNGHPFGNIGLSVFASHQPYEDGIIYESFATDSRKTVGNPTNNTTNLYIYNAISDSSLYNVRINNSTFYNTTTNTVSYNNTSPFPRIGASFSTNSSTNFRFDGYIAEQIVYTSNQTSNISGINTNINSYYSIY